MRLIEITCGYCGKQAFKSVSEVNRNIKRGNLTHCSFQCSADYKKVNRPQNTKTVRSIWAAIKQRCCNYNCNEYSYYGERGITICEEWKNDFFKFYEWAMEAGYKEGLSIDRIDNNGNYEPNNCRWATRIQQQNNRNNTFYVNVDNEKFALSDLCRVYKIKANVVRNRLNNGWDVKAALTVPVKNK